MVQRSNALSVGGELYYAYNITVLVKEQEIYSIAV